MKQKHSESTNSTKAEMLTKSNPELKSVFPD